MPMSESMTWTQCLGALSDALAILKLRLDAFADEPVENGASSAPVSYRPGQTMARANQCLVDVGAHWQRGESGPQPVRHEGICLSDKALLPPGERTTTAGVTALVLSPPPQLLQRWAEKLGADAAPDRFFRRFTLVVEDASPDSCFGLVVFLARMNGVDPSEIPRDWVEYVLLWESGVSRLEDPFRAWGPLLSALAHGHWDGELLGRAGKSAAQRAGSVPSAEEAGDETDREIALVLGKAWLACLRLTVDLLRAGSAPDPVVKLALIEDAQLATAFLRYEHQVYLHAIEHAQTLQLVLPMQGPGGRRKIIDACVLDETAIAGAKKIFLRNDREHAWLHDGFGLIALHRPELAGSGDDMTISLDPASGAHLRELWYALEAQEDVAWNGQRPNDQPRPVAGYLDGRRADRVTPSPNQPWWDDRGTYTLVAAPRRLSDGRDGSKLSWRAQVLEALWSCYRPINQLRVVDGLGQLRGVMECAPEPLRVADGKSRLLLRWPDDNSPISASGAEAGTRTQEPVLLTPTLKRCFAACIANRSLPPTQRFLLATLPQLDSFDFLPVSGGYVLVHASGVVIIDDWRPVVLCEEGISEEIDQVALRLRMLGETGAEARGMLAHLGESIERGRWRALTGGRTLDRLSELKLRLRQVLNATAPRSDDPSIARLREVLETRWGIGGKLRRLDSTLDEMERTLRSYSELRSARLINFLTVFGFPVLLLAGFFDFALSSMPSDWGAVPDWLLGKGVPPSVVGAAETARPVAHPHWPALLSYVGASVIGMLVIASVWELARWVSGLLERVRRRKGQ